MCSNGLVVNFRAWDGAGEMRSERMRLVSMLVPSLYSRSSMDPNLGGVTPIQVLPYGAPASPKREHERPQPLLSIGAATSGRIRCKGVRSSSYGRVSSARGNDLLPSVPPTRLPRLAPPLPCNEGTQPLSSPLT